MSRITGLLVFLMFYALQLPAQRFLVSNERQNILYGRTPNRVSVLVDRIDCNQIVVETDNGIISAEIVGTLSLKYLPLKILLAGITPDIGQ